jgi:hypothetical protein
MRRSATSLAAAPVASLLAPTVGAQDTGAGANRPYSADLIARRLEFRGLSNVADEKGDRYEARIAFAYSHNSPGLTIARVAADRVAEN